MIKRICKYCKKEYQTYPSINLLFCSHKCSSDFKKGKTWEELYKNAEEMFKEARGKRNSPETEFKMGWQNTEKGKEMIRKAKTTLGKKELIKTEEKAKKIIKDNNLPFTFVGDGKLIIGTKNPDFVYLGDGRKIIEIFGDYWHRDEIAKYWHQTEKGCKIYYGLLGYNVLIIWEKELRGPNKVAKKIRNFIESTLEFDVPEQTEKEFIEFSKSEFLGNRGMTLKHIWDNFKLWKVFFENMDYKLNHILELLTQDEKKPEKEKEIRMLSGEKLKRMKGGKK